MLRTTLVNLLWTLSSCCGGKCEVGVWNMELPEWKMWGFHPTSKGSDGEGCVEIRRRGISFHCQNEYWRMNVVYLTVSLYWEDWGPASIPEGPIPSFVFIAQDGIWLGRWHYPAVSVLTDVSGHGFPHNLCAFQFGRSSDSKCWVRYPWIISWNTSKLEILQHSQ